MKQTLYVPGLTLAQTFGYDKVNRLTLAVEKSGTVSSATCPDATAVWCQQFGYDQFGNRRLLPSQPSVFDAATNRFACGYTYKRGSVTRNPLNESFGYDAMDRQIAHCPAPGAEPCDATAAAGRNVYRYDAEGRRVRKSDGTASWTIFVYGAGGQLAAEDSTQAPAAGLQCLTQDHLGSTRVITRADGTVAERRDYEPFGADILVPGGSPRQGIGGYPGVGDVTLKFTGKERDQETGLDYFGARYFSGAQGRFTSPDEFNAVDELDGEAFDDYLANPQYWNRYAYSLNNPLKYKDSDGHLPHAVVGALVGGGVGGALELYSQIRSGQDMNWAKVATKTGVGAAVGATAAATFGASLLVQGTALGVVNTAAGIADRALDNDAATQALDPTALRTDAAVGVVAGVVGGAVGKQVQNAVQGSASQKLNERLADHAVRATAGRSASRQAGAREMQRQIAQHPEAMGRRAAGAGRAAAKAGTTAAAQRAAEVLKKRKEEEEQR
jgi:RHS repeat-associated protein